jgi:hypothetical protein
MKEKVDPVNSNVLIIPHPPGKHAHSLNGNYNSLISEVWSHLVYLLWQCPSLDIYNNFL